MATGKLAGKLALITGGSKGIGAAAAILLSEAGARVVVNYSSDPSSADALVEKLGGSSRAHAIKADVSSVPEIERLVKETIEWGGEGKLDILIANAAMALNRSLEDTKEDEYDRLMALNVKGPYFLVQKAAPHMPPGSHVLLLSTSLTTHTPITPNYLLYVTSKGAIEQMTRVLAKDLGRSGISVNAVAPGPTATELFYQGKSEELVKTIAGWNPFNRIGTPEEVARAYLWLVSGDSSWVNGQVLRCNGGMAV